MANTFWAGDSGNKLYLQSGQFTSTIKDSQSTVNWTSGITQDETNTYYSNYSTDKIYKYAGLIGSSVTDSIDTSAIMPALAGCSYSYTYFFAVDNSNYDLFKLNGFSTTVVDTQDVTGAAGDWPADISVDQTDSYFCRKFGQLVYQSGQFTATTKTSTDFSTIEGATRGISWNGTNTLVIGPNDDRLYLVSGRFTTTVKTSLYIALVNGGSQGIDHSVLVDRIGSPPVGGSTPIKRLRGIINDQEDFW